MEKDKTTILLQRFINTASSCIEEEIRVSKRLKDTTHVFKNLEQRALENKPLLKESRRTKDKTEKNIAHLKEIESNQQIEMIRLRQQAKWLIKKNAAFESSLQSEQMVIPKNKDIAYTKRLRLSVIKALTKMYVDEATSSNVIRGFFVNEIQNTLVPFEFDKNKVSEAECIEQLCELSQKISPYSAEWENILSGG